MNLELARIESLSGFGQSEFADSFVYRPTSVSEIQDILALAKLSGRKVVLRGAGRSYGDPAILDESISLDFTRMNRVLNWDPSTGVLECEPGVTIDQAWRTAIEDGWWPPVVSGTSAPTLAGALGMNIHGKNNFKAGTIGEHVTEIDLLDAAGALRTLTPDDELFYAVVSGFGMFGIITRVELQMKKITSGNVKVLAISPRNWGEQIDAFENHSDADYMVSWIDMYGDGAGSGRGQFHAAWYLHPENPDLHSLKLSSQTLPSKLFMVVPTRAVWKVLKSLRSPLGVRFMNWGKDMAGKVLENHKTTTQSLVAFNFLLDYVPRWRDAYLPGGFIQYQSFIPRDRAGYVFEKQHQLQKKAGIVSHLAVMKRHRPDRFLLSHAVDGYSLAQDFRVTRRNRQYLLDLCHQMNDVVLEAGGRFYLAKDSTLRQSDVEAYLGPEAIEKIKSLKAELDPEHLFSSRLSQRLFGF